MNIAYFINKEATLVANEKCRIEERKNVANTKNVLEAENKVELARKVVNERQALKENSQKKLSNMKITGFTALFTGIVLDVFLNYSSLINGNFIPFIKILGTFGGVLAIASLISIPFVKKIKKELKKQTASCQVAEQVYRNYRDELVKERAISKGNKNDPNTSKVVYLKEEKALLDDMYYDELKVKYGVPSHNDEVDLLMKDLVREEKVRERVLSSHEVRR